MRAKELIKTKKYGNDFFNSSLKLCLEVHKRMKWNGMNKSQRYRKKKQMYLSISNNLIRYIYIYEISNK